MYVNLKLPTASNKPQAVFAVLKQQHFITYSNIINICQVYLFMIHHQIKCIRNNNRFEFKFRDEIQYLHNLILSPEDAILVEILRGIKPEAISLLSPSVCASISINICLNSPLFTPNVSQELKIDFIMVLLIRVSVRHLS